MTGVRVPEGPGVLAGEPEPAAETMTQAAYFARFSSHAAVLARAAMTSPEDVAEDRARERQRAAALERREDYAGQVALGLASARSHEEILAGFEAECARQDIEDARLAKRERDEMAADEAGWRRRRSLEAELARAERRRFQAIRQANAAHKARRAAEQAAASYRSAVFGSYR